MELRKPPFNPSVAEWQAFVKRLAALPPEEIKRRNQEQEDETARAHAEFRTAFAGHQCSMCGKPLATFSTSAPCFHWLLRPKGVKKPHIEEVLEAKGYFRSATYLRWVANEGAFLARINDLKAEKDPETIFHWCAIYGHIKWTFWCKPTDLAGHAGKHASFPHFHFEMRLQGNPFIGFNDFHVPFSDDDLFKLRSNQDDACIVKHGFGSHGAGMQDAFDVPAEKILSETRTTDDKETAVYHIQSIIEDPKGIPGEVIVDLFEKSQQSGKPVAHFLKESGLPAQTIITPVDVLPINQARRKTRGGGTSNNSATAEPKPANL